MNVATATGVGNFPPTWRARGAIAGPVAAAIGGLVLHLWPQLGIELFAAGAARLAGVLTGAAVDHGDTGWLLTLAGLRVAVTRACGGTDYFLIVAGLLGWHIARGRGGLLRAIAGGLALALPLAIFVNALRIIAVTHAHRWVIPHLPETYRTFAHMAAGVAVFLPALIGLNLLLEIHARSRHSAVRTQPEGGPCAPCAASSTGVTKPRAERTAHRLVSIPSRKNPFN